MKVRASNYLFNLGAEVKKLLLAFALVSSQAIADVGPVWVSMPAYCNIMKVYVKPDGAVYGSEVGCSNTVGSPFIGMIGAEGAYGAQNAGAASSSCLTLYGNNMMAYGRCGSATGATMLPPTQYVISTTKPANAFSSSNTNYYKTSKRFF